MAYHDEEAVSPNNS